MNCPECHEDLEKFGTFLKNMLFCPFCGSPLSSQTIKEWEIPQLFTQKNKIMMLSPDVKGIIRDLKGNIIGFISNNNKCAEINLLGVMLIRLNFKLLHSEIFIDKDGKRKLDIMRMLVK